MSNLANFDTRPDALERQVRAPFQISAHQGPAVQCEYSNLNYNILGSDFGRLSAVNPYARLHSKTKSSTRWG